nr:uncharacterized protein LOC106619535 isoform X2 [Bactrocera oleae]
MIKDHLVQTSTSMQYQLHLELWFIQVEAQLGSQNIWNDNIMYQAVLGTLNPEVFKEVSDILWAPPVQDKYTYLKTNLINRFIDLVHRQLYKQLTELELGNRKPSQLLREIKTLAAIRASEELQKHDHDPELQNHQVSVFITADLVRKSSMASTLHLQVC